MYLKEAIIETLRRKRNFAKSADCIDAINKTLCRLGAKEIIPSFLIFDGSFQYSKDKKFAVSVVFGDPRHDSRKKVAYLLSEMEKYADQNEITGGLVIYITNHLSEWEHNSIIALERDYDYYGNPVSLTARPGTYVDKWDEKYGGLSAKRRYALFFTEGAKEWLDI